MYKCRLVAWTIMIGSFTCQSLFNMYINYSALCFNNSNAMKNLCLIWFFYSGFFSTYLSISVDDFYPFGDENGDSKLPRRDDAVSQSIEFPTSFAFFNVDRHNCSVSIFYLNICGWIIKKYLDVSEYNSKGLCGRDYFKFILITLRRWILCKG